MLTLSLNPYLPAPSTPVSHPFTLVYFNSRYGCINLLIYLLEILVIVLRKTARLWLAGWVEWCGGAREGWRQGVAREVAQLAIASRVQLILICSVDLELGFWPASWLSIVVLLALVIVSISNIALKKTRS